MRTTNFALTFLILFASLLAAGRTQGQDAPVVPDKPATKYRYWTSNWSFESIDLKDLSRKIEAFGILIPVQLEGIASVDFDVSVPLNALRTPEAYKFRGTLDATNLRVDDLFLPTLRADVVYEGGVLRLDRMQGNQET